MLSAVVVFAVVRVWSSRSLVMDSMVCTLMVAETKTVGVGVAEQYEPVGEVEEGFAGEAVRVGCARSAYNCIGVDGLYLGGADDVAAEDKSGLKWVAAGGIYSDSPSRTHWRYPCPTVVTVSICSISTSPERTLLLLETRRIGSTYASN